jgi:hypothetical protein
MPEPVGCRHGHRLALRDLPQGRILGDLGTSMSASVIGQKPPRCPQIHRNRPDKIRTGLHAGGPPVKRLQPARHAGAAATGKAPSRKPAVRPDRIRTAQPSSRYFKKT